MTPGNGVLTRRQKQLLDTVLDMPESLRYSPSNPPLRENIGIPVGTPTYGKRKRKDLSMSLEFSPVSQVKAVKRKQSSPHDLEGLREHEASSLLSLVSPLGGGHSSTLQDVSLSPPATHYGFPLSSFKLSGGLPSSGVSKGGVSPPPFPYARSSPQAFMESPLPAYSASLGSAGTAGKVGVSPLSAAVSSSFSPGRGGGSVTPSPSGGLSPSRGNVASPRKRGVGIGLEGLKLPPFPDIKTPPKNPRGSTSSRGVGGGSISSTNHTEGGGGGAGVSAPPSSDSPFSIVKSCCKRRVRTPPLLVGGQRGVGSRRNERLRGVDMDLDENFQGGGSDQVGIRDEALELGGISSPGVRTDAATASKYPGCIYLQNEPENPLPSTTLPPSCRNLPLSSKLSALDKSYTCLRNALDHCYNHNRITVYQTVKPIVERLSNHKRFSLEILRQIAWIAPQLIRLQWRYSNQTDEPSHWKYDVEIIELEGCGEAGDTASPKKDDAYKSASRLAQFRSSLVRWAGKHHDEFLRKLAPNMRVPPIKSLHKWHGQFDYENILTPPAMQLDPPSEACSPTTRGRSLSPISSVRRARQRSVSPILRIGASKGSRPTTPMRVFGNETASPSSSLQEAASRKTRSPAFDSSLLLERETNPFFTRDTLSPKRVHSPAQLRTFSSPNSSKDADSLKEGVLLSPIKNFRNFSSEENTSARSESPVEGEMEGRAKYVAYMDSDSLTRIHEKAKKNKLAKDMLISAQERRKPQLEKWEFWQDVLWVFERMVEDFMNSGKLPISKLSILAQKYSTKYTRVISAARVEECIFTLERLCPQTVERSKAWGSKDDFNIKFNTTSGLCIAYETLRDMIDESAKALDNPLAVDTPTSENLPANVREESKPGEAAEQA